MRITISDLKKLSNAEILNKESLRSIKGVSIDSRKIKEGDLFFDD